MKNHRAIAGWGLLSLLCTLVVAPQPLHAQTTTGPVTAQAKRTEQSRDLDGRFAPKNLQTGEGVIVKMETVGESKKGEHRPRRIEINQNIVWRDWVRDQASVTNVQRSNTAAAAKKGKSSVATVGQPKGANSEVVLEVPLNAKIETRFRSSTDEISQGATTPGKAAVAEKATDAYDKVSQVKAKAATKTKAHPDPAAPGTLITDLKSGLFVEYEYTKKGDKNVVSRIRIMRPVGGAATPAGEAKPK